MDFPQNDSWVFVADDHQFLDVTAPWDYTNSMNIDDLLSAKMDADFTAVKVGDVNNTASVNGTKIESRNSQNLYLSAADKTFAKGDLVEIPFYLEEDITIAGMQLTVEFDSENLLFQGLDGAELNMSESNFALLNNHDGVITISYSGVEDVELANGDDFIQYLFRG